MRKSNVREITQFPGRYFLSEISSKKKIELNKSEKDKKMAPAAGFEPATKWLTATYSTAELCRSVISRKRMIRNIHDFSFFASLKNTFFEK